MIFFAWICVAVPLLCLLFIIGLGLSQMDRDDLIEAGSMASMIVLGGMLVFGIVYLAKHNTEPAPALAEQAH